MSEQRVVAAIAVLFFCLSSNVVLAQSAAVNARPHVLVYKTKGKYRNNVPVVLSADKKTVVSYPDPTDIQTGSASALPVSLHKGYLLDKRGVGWNTAFLKLSYDAYSKLKVAPSVDELYKMVTDKNPMTELWDCGVRDDAGTGKASLNKLIDKKQLKKKCKPVEK